MWTLKSKCSSIKTPRYLVQVFYLIFWSLKRKFIFLVICFLRDGKITISILLTIKAILFARSHETRFDRSKFIFFVNVFERTTGIWGCCYLKVQSLFSACIFKNMMNNYGWTPIIWWKGNIFICFIKCYWIKNLLSIVIQNKKYLVVFNKHEINSLHVYYLISCVIFGLFFSFFMQNWILRYTYKYFFQHVLKFSFYNLHFLKALRT